MSPDIAGHIPQLIVPIKRESADEASQRRHYADAKYVRDAVEK